MRRIGTQRWRPPPTTPVSSLRRCRPRALTWLARATLMVNPCGRRFAIFCRKQRRLARTCRPSSTSPAAGFSITATITSFRSTLRSIATPTCRSKRSALPISATLSRRRPEERASSFSMRRAPIPMPPRVRRSRQGLRLVDPERGELIAFNAAPGTLAGDEEGPYGVYGKTLCWRDPAGRRRYRPGVRSDARVGQFGDARGSAAMERLQTRGPVLRLRARRRRAPSDPLVSADGAPADIQFLRRGRLRRRNRARHAQGVP